MDESPHARQLRKVPHIQAAVVGKGVQCFVYALVTALDKQLKADGKASKGKGVSKDPPSQAGD